MNSQQRAWTASPNYVRVIQIKNKANLRQDQSRFFSIDIPSDADADIFCAQNQSLTPQSKLPQIERSGTHQNLPLTPESKPSNQCFFPTHQKSYTNVFKEEEAKSRGIWIQHSNSIRRNELENQVIPMRDLSRTQELNSSFQSDKSSSSTVYTQNFKLSQNNSYAGDLNIKSAVVEDTKSEAKQRYSLQLSQEATAFIRKKQQANKQKLKQHPYIQQIIGQLKFIKRLNFDLSMLPVGQRLTFNDPSKSLLIIELATLVYAQNKRERDINKQLVYYEHKGQRQYLEVEVRPFAFDLILQAQQSFNILLFTRYRRSYATAILQYLDPRYNLFKNRLYKRNCFYIQGIFVKDLRIIQNLNIQKTVIVDQDIYGFAFNLDSGIPVRQWRGEPDDKELKSLSRILHKLLKCSDFRSNLDRMFSLKKLLSKV